MNKYITIFMLLLFLMPFTALVAAASQTGAEEKALMVILPASCPGGWLREGKVAIYDRANLFERINGESELFFPYGFESLVSARYVSADNPQLALEADVYRLGSLLDAFGMFANYHRADAAEVAIGGEGNYSPGQEFFYQDRYLVRLQSTTTNAPEQEVFDACARVISGNLPSNRFRPEVLNVFDIPEVVRSSKLYIASSLLGYEFFRRGVVADAQQGNNQALVFVVLEDSVEAARTAFNRYVSYLKGSGKNPEIKAQTSVKGADPLYGNVYVETSGRFLIGAAKMTNWSSAAALVAKLRERLDKLKLR